MVFLKLIFESVRRQKSLYGLWILSLAIAVSGLMIVDVFRQSLTETLKSQGRKILSADAALSTRRLLSENEIQIFEETVPAPARFARMTEMFAMVTGAKESRLALLRFISEDYPLIGELTLKDHSNVVTGKLLYDRPEAWAAGDLFTLLGLQAGDSIRIGSQDFILVGQIDKDSSQTFRMGNMAPRVYISRRYLPSTGLVQYGSTLTDLFFTSSSAPLAGIKEKLEAKLKDTSLQITVPSDLEQGSLSVLSRLLDYLGLIGLVTLSLGWIGVYYLGRRWLSLETKSVGVLKCLGFSSDDLRRLLLIKLSLALSAGVISGGVLAWFAAHALLPFIRDSLPADFDLFWSWKNTLLLVLIGPIAGTLLLWQPVAQLTSQKPLDLFQDRARGAQFNFRLALQILLGLSLLFVAVTFLQARSWLVTAAFIGSLAVSVIAVSSLSYGWVRFMQGRDTRNWHWVTHVINALWTRRSGATILLISVSALAGQLSQLLPHLQKTLVGEIKSPAGVERPGLFMVDIQDEQLEPLKTFLEQKGYAISQYSPFIRARIVSVNGIEFERGQSEGVLTTREQENEVRFRNRGANLSYRKELSSTEKIISGKEWSELSVNPPEIAVEERYADRLGLKLGDSLRFDIQGLEIEARIAALRKIRWESFSPNFFIQFPDGVLNDAPKTWIMALKAHPSVPIANMQTQITRQFPNITSINISEALDTIAEMVGKLSEGMKMAGQLSLALGVLVFLMILLFQLASARKDWTQLLVLGLTSRQVWALQVLAYGALCLIGTWMGAALSLMIAWALFKFAFHSAPDFDWPGMIRVWLTLWITAIGGLALLGFIETRSSRASLSSENLRD